jgi:hypothetical protein
VLAPDRQEALGMCDDGWRAASIATLPLAAQFMSIDAKIAVGCKT